MSSVEFAYTVPANDFTRAGEASSDVKSKLKQLGINPVAIRRVAVAMYEGEINMVIHGGGGSIVVEITPEALKMTLADEGPGIADIELAMSEGYSTAGSNARNMGFGAGMGMPNMKKYSDLMTVTSTVGVGTTVEMIVNF